MSYSQQNIARWPTYSKGKCNGGSQEDFEDEWRKSVLVKMRHELIWKDFKEKNQSQIQFLVRTSN